jgi:hypothetical protein
MKQPKDINELRWIRVFTPIHIPKKYVENIKPRRYSVEDFYKYQDMVCLTKTGDGFTLNPLSHLYVLANKDNETKGFLWFVIDPLTKDLIVQSYSVDRDYWGKGAVEKLATHIKEIRKKANLNKIFWITDFPNHSKKYGFKPSNSILMEYSEEQEDGTNIDGGSEPDGEREPIIAGAATVSE